MHPRYVPGLAFEDGNSGDTPGILGTERLRMRHLPSRRGALVTVSLSTGHGTLRARPSIVILAMSEQEFIKRVKEARLRHTL